MLEWCAAFCVFTTLVIGGLLILGVMALDRELR